MRKFTKLLVAAAFLLTSITSPLVASANVSSFADLNKADAWAQAGIVKAKELGLISGDTKGNFNPLAKVTRQEAASILARMLKLDTTGYTTSSFSDVPAGLWGLGQIEAVKKAGLMIGEQGKFRPNDALTREELAVILVKAAGIDATGQGKGVNFADKGSISPWALDAVGAAFNNGLMVGANNKFNPKATTTRQELAVVAVNFSHALLSTVQNVTEGTVTISGTTYEIGDAVKGIFALKNKDILLGAKIKFSADGTTLTEVKELEITASGKPAATGAAEFSSNLVLDGAGAVVKGSLKVAGNYITLQNLTIEGDLIIGEELQNDFYSNGLTVKGKTVVNGGDTNTVVFNNANLGAVNVNKPNVRMEAKGKSTIGEMTVTSDATIHADNGVTIPKLTVGTGAKNVEIDAPVGTLDVLNSNAKLNVKKPIDKVVLPDGTKIDDLLENFEQIKDLLKEVLIGNKPVDPKPTTPSTPNTPTPTPVTEIPTEAPGTINFAEGTDLVEGSAKLGTTIKIYDAATGGELLGSTVAQSNIISLIPSDYVHFYVRLVNGLPSGANKVYITYTEQGKRESARQAITYVNVPEAPSADQIEVHNSTDQDYIVLNNVPAHTEVEVFTSADEQDSIAYARNENANMIDRLLIPIPGGSPDGLEGLSNVHVAYVLHDDEHQSKGVSARIAKDVPAEADASAQPSTATIADYKNRDNEVSVAAPIGAVVRVYKNGVQIGMGESDGSVAHVKIQQELAESTLELDEYIYVTITELGKEESAQHFVRVPGEYQVSTPVQANTHLQNNFENGKRSILINGVPALTEVYVYSSETGTPIMTGYNASLTAASVSTNEYALGEDVETLYVTYFANGVESEPIELAVPEVAVSDAPHETDIEVMNYSDLADTVVVKAPVGSMVRLYDANGGEITKGFSQENGDGTVSAKFSFPTGLTASEDLQVTVQEPDKFVSVKTTVTVSAPPAAPLESDIKIYEEDGYYQIVVDNVPGNHKVAVYNAATDVVPFRLEENVNEVSGTKTIHVNGSLPVAGSNFYIAIQSDHAESTRVLIPAVDNTL